MHHYIDVSFLCTNLAQNTSSERRVWASGCETWVVQASMYSVRQWKLDTTILQCTKHTLLLDLSEDTDGVRSSKLTDSWTFCVTVNSNSLHNNCAVCTIVNATNFPLMPSYII